MPTLIKQPCKKCQKLFLTRIAEVKRGWGIFCSWKCRSEFKSKSQSIITNCNNCNIDFKKINSQAKRSSNHFCSQSCAATYNNKHRKSGYRRSKLEEFIETKIREVYPKIELLCNSKTAINHELDFFFPTLKLAIEINGIFHYKPIYGEEKFNQIKKNDKEKKKFCKKNGIKLHVLKDPFTKFSSTEGEKFWKKVDKILSKLVIQH